LSNRAGERLLGQSFERLAGRSARTLGLAPMLTGDSPRVYDSVFPGGGGRWEVRRATFRQDGRPHTMLVVADVSKTLREEELQAWQRLVRVLSHEINNSLAPIKSIAGSLQGMLERSAAHGETGDDLRRGLSVIGSRADALSRFMSSYARLARLPAPRRQEVAVGPWVRRVAALETRLEVEVLGGPELSMLADGDQLDQALINLVRNAADAALTTGGGVEIEWTTDEGAVEVRVTDDGPGLSSTANLFVPFFTTKPDGSGIGLVLSRQIAEAHGGMLTLENRTGVRGCIARLRLPRESRMTEAPPASRAAS
jgi:signal transduction histidine kinase